MRARRGHGGSSRSGAGALRCASCRFLACVVRRASGRCTCRRYTGGVVGTFHAPFAARVTNGAILVMYLKGAPCALGGGGRHGRPIYALLLSPSPSPLVASSRPPPLSLLFFLLLLSADACLALFRVCPPFFSPSPSPLAVAPCLPPLSLSFIFSCFLSGARQSPFPCSPYPARGGRCGKMAASAAWVRLSGRLPRASLR